VDITKGWGSPQQRKDGVGGKFIQVATVLMFLSVDLAETSSDDLKWLRECFLLMRTKFSAGL